MCKKVSLVLLIMLHPPNPARKMSFPITFGGKYPAKGTFALTSSTCVLVQGKASKCRGEVEAGLGCREAGGATGEQHWRLAEITGRGRLRSPGKVGIASNGQRLSKSSAKTAVPPHYRGSPGGQIYCPQVPGKEMSVPLCLSLLLPSMDFTVSNLRLTCFVWLYSLLLPPRCCSS